MYKIPRGGESNTNIRVEWIYNHITEWERVHSLILDISLDGLNLCQGKNKCMWNKVCRVTVIRASTWTRNRWIGYPWQQHLWIPQLQGRTCSRSGTGSRIPSVALRDDRRHQKQVVHMWNRTKPTQQPVQSHREDRPVEDSCTRSYPHVRHRGRGVKELADDVGGGSNAEEDGANDLLPPGQQQHGILPPATPSACFVPLDQANGSVALLSVDVAVGEGVAIVWKERVKKGCCDCSSS